MDGQTREIKLTKGVNKLSARETYTARLAKRYTLDYDEVLDHIANEHIEIDLDDGVKVNYAKFQGVELVTDGGAKVKKDLLSPIK